MPKEQRGTLLIRDEAGNYYLITREMLEAARVPEERKAEVKALAEGEVQGFVQGNFVPGGQEFVLIGLLPAVQPGAQAVQKVREATGRPIP